MKVPLMFQVTEFDCASITLLNAFSYLFEREEIPAELVRAIYEYTLDSDDEKGNLGAGGTSREAIKLLMNTINNYATTKNFNVNCVILEHEEVSLNNIKPCINMGGVVYLRTYLEEYEHYVIIIKLDLEYAYIFDPYYLDKSFYNENDKIKIVFDQPFKYNRLINLNELESLEMHDLAMGPIALRECVLINKKTTQ